MGNQILFSGTTKSLVVKIKLKILKEESNSLLCHRKIISNKKKKKKRRLKVYSSHKDGRRWDLKWAFNELLVPALFFSFGWSL